MSVVIASFPLSLPTFALLTLPSTVWGPYLAGVVVLLIGLVIKGKRFEPINGLDGLVQFGPLFFAIPMAIFGADHLTAAKFVAMLVPAWMPGKLFWSYFVGFALLAAALSLVTGIQQRLASAMLGAMIFLFVLTIHVPACFATPFDHTRLTVLLRDSLLSLCALTFAASIPRKSATAGDVFLHAVELSQSKVMTGVRIVIALVIGFFGINQFLHPTAAPGIPQESPTFVQTMPSWIPAHTFWSVVVGAVFLVCAVGLLSPRRAHLAAVTLGLTSLLLSLLVYLPITISRASDIANGLNYLAIHFALAGAALFLARGLTSPEVVPTSTENEWERFVNLFVPEAATAAGTVPIASVGSITEKSTGHAAASD